MFGVVVPELVVGQAQAASGFGLIPARVLQPALDQLALEIFDLLLERALHGGVARFRSEVDVLGGDDAFGVTVDRALDDVLCSAGRRR